MLMLLLLFFSALLLASLSAFLFFWSTCPCVRSECPCSPRWSRGSLLVPIAGFEAMFWVEWVGADAAMRLVGISSMEGFACAHLRPITAITFPRSRRTGRFISQSSTWLLVGKAGWLASGTRGRLICQLRQFGPPLCGPPYRRPPAESSHGCYGRRTRFQELLLYTYNIYIYIILYYIIYMYVYNTMYI